MTRKFAYYIGAFAQEVRNAGKRKNPEADVDALVDDMIYAASRSVEDFTDRKFYPRRSRAINASLVELYYDAETDKFYWDVFSSDDTVSRTFPNYVEETYTEAEYLLDDEGNEKDWTNYLNLTFSELLEPETVDDEIPF